MTEHAPARPDPPYSPAACRPPAVEQQLQESEARYRTIVETAHEGIWIIDPDDRTTFVNGRLAEMLGYTVDEMLGQSLYRFMDEEAEAIARDQLARRREGVSDRLDSRFQRKDGSHLWAIVSANPLTDSAGAYCGALAMVTDISERRATEEALRENQAHLQALVGSLDDIVFEFDAEGTYLNVWTSDESLLARPRSEILGSRVTEVLGEELGRPFLEVFRRVLATGQPETVEYTLDVIGGTRWFHARVTPVAAPDGSYRTVCMLPRDITPRKQGEEALRSANLRLETAVEELQQAQEQTIRQERLHALGEMASGIAHDFNNSLAVILGFTDLLLRDPRLLDDRAKATSYLELVRTAASDAAGVVRRLREFYRPGDQQDEGAPVDLNRIVGESVSMTRPRWSNQALANGRVVRVETDLWPVPEVWGDEASLREALTNLIFNAVDAIPGDGGVTLRTRLDGDRVVVEVTDTGGGMSDEVRRRCMEPFFTTKGEHGSGLGLSMVYGVASRHRGTLEIDSVRGLGTTVTLRLPTGRPRRSDDAPALTVPVRPLRVLLVDDEPAVRGVVAKFLAFDGHQVQATAGGAEALRHLEAEPYELLVADRAMPGMTGDELAAAVATASPETAVLLLSGFGDLMLAAGEHPPGVDVVAGKPIDLVGLRRAVASALAARDVRRAEAASSPS